MKNVDAEVETAIQYLNRYWKHYKKEVRPIPDQQDRYSYYSLDTGEPLHWPMSEQQVIDKALYYRVCEWRQVYFKPGPTPSLIQCTICGEVFEGATCHMAPCVQVSSTTVKSGLNATQEG